MEQIGRYRILDELGRGATGVVFRAQDPAIGRIIAIKTIRLSDFTDDVERDRLRERLFREAQSAGILSHPNIVTIYDIAEEGGMAYIFMEYVDGAPLERLLNGPEPVPKDALLGILQQTAVALDYAHRKGIVHRDIKPANILIHEGSVAKITDFGVAKILSQQMTQSGVMMGTPNYMSPEQVQGHAVDGRADQFALAVIAYEVLTGEKPFVGEHLPGLLYRIVREEPVAPQRLNPSLTPQVEVVLRKGLAKNAPDRYSTCTDFVEALSAACNANPGWHPMPRSSAHSLPTIGAGAAIDHTAVHRPPQAEPEAAGVDLPPARPLRHSDRDGNPVLKSLVWMLVAIGLVGLVLYGAQKFLFNRGETGPPAQAAEASAPPPTSSPAPEKPSPVGDSRSASPPEMKSAASSDATSKQPAGTEPAASSPAATPPSAPAVKSGESASAEPPPDRAPHRATPAAAESEPRPASERTIQILTDPPGGQVVVDDNPGLTCKAPCMLSVTIGRHVLNAQLKGYRAYPRIFNVPEVSDLFLQLSKVAGTLSVTSTPPGATIRINDVAQDKRTPAIFQLDPGNYHVRVTRNGAFLDFDVSLRDGQLINKNVSFQ